MNERVMNESDGDGDGLRARLDLDSEPGNVRVARSFVANSLTLWDCEDPDRIIELLTSEVVTNAVRYARGSIRLEAVLVDDSVVRVETTDQVPTIPVVQSSDSLSEGGRGLVLVQELAARWGVDSSADRKVVWFEVPISRRST